MRYIALFLLFATPAWALTDLSATDHAADVTATSVFAAGTSAGAGITGYYDAADLTAYLDTLYLGITADAAGVAANSVALTTDTTGNYVSSATANGGLALTGTEGGSLGMITSCSDNQVLAYTAAGGWACADPTAAETNSLETTITGIADAEIFIGNGADSGTFKGITGDVSLANTGAVTIAAGAVEASMLAATLDLSGKTITLGAPQSPFPFPSGAGHTTDAAGESGFDSNAWGSGRGALQLFDGTANVYVPAILATDTCTNGQVPKFNTGGTWTCEDDSGAAGGDSISIDSSAVVDPDFVSTGDIDFVDTSNTITANLNADVVAAAEMADADHGDVSWTSGVATVEEVNNGTSDATLSNAGELHLNTTDEQLSFHSAADGEISGEAALSLIQHLAVTFDPAWAYDQESNYRALPLLYVGDDAPEGITITEWRVRYVGGDPTTELDADLRCDTTPDYNTAAGSTVMDALDTTAGASSADTGFDSASCANGANLHITFGADPTDANVLVAFDLWFYYEED